MLHSRNQATCWTHSTRSETKVPSGQTEHHTACCQDAFIPEPWRSSYIRSALANLRCAVARRVELDAAHVTTVCSQESVADAVHSRRIVYQVVAARLAASVLHAALHNNNVAVTHCIRLLIQATHVNKYSMISKLTRNAIWRYQVSTHPAREMIIR